MCLNWLLGVLPYLRCSRMTRLRSCLTKPYYTMTFLLNGLLFSSTTCVGELAGPASCRRFVLGLCMLSIEWLSCMLLKLMHLALISMLRLKFGLMVAL